MAELREDLDRLTLPIELRDSLERPSGLRGTTPERPPSLHVLHGRESLEAFARALEGPDVQEQLLRSPFFRDLYFVMGTFDTLRARIEKADVGDTERHHLISRLSFLYTSRSMLPLQVIAELSDAGGLQISAEAPQVQMLQMILRAHHRMKQFVGDHNV